MLIDMHTHTYRCGHAEGSALEYAYAAIAAGVDVLGITEHHPLPDGYDPLGVYSMRPGELSDYVAEVRSVAGSITKTRVLLGIEADWIPEHITQVADSISKHPFDVVMGAVHFLDEWTFDDPEKIDEWSGRDVTDVWQSYFSAFTRAASSGHFDVMAHPDLVKKFGFRPPGDMTKLYADVAGAIADTGVAIEVSSAGLRKPCAELYPSDELLAAFARSGVPATTGSDAHKPSEVGFGLDRAIESLVAAGYGQVVYFEEREMRKVSL